MDIFQCSVDAHFYEDSLMERSSERKKKDEKICHED